MKMTKVEIEISQLVPIFIIVVTIILLIGAVENIWFLWENKGYSEDHFFEITFRMGAIIGLGWLGMKDAENERKKGE